MEASTNNESFDPSKYSACPFQFWVVGKHNEAFACMAYRFQPSLGKRNHAGAQVACSIWRVRVEAIKVHGTRKWVSHVVKLGTDVIKAFFLRKPCDRITNPLV